MRNGPGFLPPLTRLATPVSSRRPPPWFGGIAAQLGGPGTTNAGLARFRGPAAAAIRRLPHPDIPNDLRLLLEGPTVSWRHAGATRSREDTVTGVANRYALGQLALRNSAARVP